MLLDERRPDLLFSAREFETVGEQRREALREHVYEIPEERLATTEEAELVRQLVSHHIIDVPVLTDETVHTTVTEGWVSFTDEAAFGGLGSVRGPVYWFQVDFTGDATIFGVFSQTKTTPLAYGDVRGRTIVLKIESKNATAETVEAAIHENTAAILENLACLRGVARELENDLLQLATDEVRERKGNLAKAEHIVKRLGFRLRPRADFSKLFGPDPIDDAPSQAGPDGEAEAMIERDYLKILRVIKHMSLVMERSPGAFIDLKEEHLRDFYLVFLNGVYEGAAIGETFNYGGRTDILIRQNDVNIFIAECKFWDGPVHYLETIDQIIKYISWRDGRAAIIVFNRNENFSEVCTKIHQTTKSHPHFKSGTEEDSTQFRYVFVRREDPNKEFVLTVQAFNVPH
ncbi:hypothetical protein ACCS43_28230 [Rhizobium ruizarguesonis]